MENKYGFISDEKVYLKGFLGNPDREIGRVLLTEDKAVEYFENRFLVLSEKVDKLEAELNDSENKGSFLMKIVHIQDSLASYNGLGDFEGLHERLEGLKDVLKVSVDENRKRNLAIKEELLDKMQNLVERREWEEDAEEVKEIHKYWLRVGRVVEDKEALLERAFKAFVDQFFLEKRLDKERKDKVVKDRINHYRNFDSRGKEPLSSS